MPVFTLPRTLSVFRSKIVTSLSVPSLVNPLAEIVGDGDAVHAARIRDGADNFIGVGIDDFGLRGNAKRRGDGSRYPRKRNPSGLRRRS